MTVRQLTDCVYIYVFYKTYGVLMLGRNDWLCAGTCGESLELIYCL